MGILGTKSGKREPIVKYRTIDGGHPAPYPEMTDEQLYNYEVAFNVPRRTFDKPPRQHREVKTPMKEEPIIRREPKFEPRFQYETRSEPLPEKPEQDETPEPRPAESGRTFDAPRYTARASREARETRLLQEYVIKRGSLAALDLTKPVRTITTKHPVEIVTTRARHPIYTVHGYIGDDDVVTVFTADGRLSEHGPRFLENVPQTQQLYLNIYLNLEGNGGEKYIVTQHDSKESADAAAKPGRVACVGTQFDL